MKTEFSKDQVIFILENYLSDETLCVNKTGKSLDKIKLLLQYIGASYDFINFSKGIPMYSQLADAYREKNQLFGKAMTKKSFCMRFGIEEQVLYGTKFNNDSLRIAVKDWLTNSEITEIKYGHISCWDTSEVTDMSKLFENTTSFNQPIGNWDVVNVINMHAMFANAVIFNQPIGDWDVSKVTDMSEMFSCADAFNQPLGNWDVSNVNNMKSMFAGSNAKTVKFLDSGFTRSKNMPKKYTIFNQSIGNWDVSKVNNMSQMFFYAENFNQPIDNWKVHNVTNMSGMFSGTQAFNQSIGNWDVSKVNNMSQIFFYAENFNQPINNWKVHNITNISGMFSGTQAFNQPVGNWDVGNITNMSGMFSGAQVFNQPLGNWDVSNVTDMDSMFEDANSFNQPLNGWDVSSVTNMNYLFKEALSFNQDISGWCVTNITSKPIQFSINSPLIESNKPSILQKTQTNSVQRKGIFYFKKLFKSRDYVEIDSGLHFMNSLNDAVLYEYFLRGNSIDASGNFMRSNFFSGTGPAQPYFDYVLLSLINDAPAKTKMDQSLKRTSIKRIHLEAEIPYHAGNSYTKNCGKYSAFKLPDLAFKNLEEISIFNYQNLESLKFLLNCKKLKRIELTRCDNIKDADLFEKQILKNE